MTKVVINRCYGGYSISKEAYTLICERKQVPMEIDDYGYHAYYVDWPRDDKDLVEAVTELGSKAASGALAELTIATIPDDVEWEIEEYDGIEWVAEKHRCWYGDDE